MSSDHRPPIDILVSEVGPRDGLQSIQTILTTEAKKHWIAAEAAAGVREIEVGSFVPAKLLPQLADTAEVAAFACSLPGLTVAALVPNTKGADAAIRAGVHKLTLPISASETHHRRNLRRSHVQSLEEVRAIAAVLRALPAERRPRFEGSVSTAFGCTLEGSVSSDKVVALAEALLDAGVDEVSLADTTGFAHPRQIRGLVREVHVACGAEALTGLHLHNTRGLGLANVLAGLEVGITTFDSSLGGLGGCPFAPGASGNLVTEDLVFMLEAEGLRTGIDLERLFKVRHDLAKALPTESLYGFSAESGLPLGFSPASKRLSVHD